MGMGGACDWNDSRFVPNELIGVWRTDDVRYRGRAIELGKESAVIETASDQASTAIIYFSYRLLELKNIKPWTRAMG